MGRASLLSRTIYATVPANLVTLWMARGPYVTGWDLSGATFAVLALQQGSITDGVHAILTATLNQQRPVFTGGESLIYGLIPGLLNMVWPSLFWGHVLNLALFVAISVAITHWLGCRPHLYWACILASPALVSYAIVAYPYVPSTTIPYALAIGWVLSGRQPRRRAWWGLLLDVAVFALIAAIAFNGYESGKTAFVVPAIAALTVRGIPFARRLGWLAVAAAFAWVVFELRPNTTAVALETLPRDPAIAAQGLVRAAKAYANGWDIDYPGLGLAAVLTLPSIRTQRPFWAVLLAAVVGLVLLNAFQFEGGFLTPHRFLLLPFVAALVVSVALSERLRWTPALAGAALLVATGVAYTSYHTVRFALRDRPALVAPSDPPIVRVYPLPYHRAKLDQHIWPTRIRDAMRLVELARQGHEPHLLFYGFSIAGEDSVNPQFLMSRLLLSLGYPAFRERIVFVDHRSNMYFDFPIRPLLEVSSIAEHLSVPFFLHVREPEYSVPAVLAEYFNRARVVPVDLGLRDFKSFRVEEFSSPGPIPVEPLPALVDAPQVPSEKGYCLALADLLAGPQGNLEHQGTSLAQRIDFVLAWNHDRVSKRFVPTPELQVQPGTFSVFTARFNEPADRPMLVRFRVTAADESAILLNGQPVAEELGWHRPADYTVEALLPPGPNELRLVHHQYWHPGTVSFSSTDADGQAILWQCNPDFS